MGLFGLHTGLNGIGGDKVSSEITGKLNLLPRCHPQGTAMQKVVIQRNNPGTGPQGHVLPHKHTSLSRCG